MNVDFTFHGEVHPRSMTGRFRGVIRLNGEELWNSLPDWSYPSYNESRLRDNEEDAQRLAEHHFFERISSLMS